MAKFTSFLKNQQQINSAKVIIVDPSLNFRVRISEEKMQEVGKLYGTEDRDRISGLIKIIEESDVHDRVGSGVAASDISSNDFEPREGIYLFSKDGEIYKFLFSKKYEGASTVQGSFNGRPITARSSIPRALQSWVDE
ncbi:hypothetical protein Bsp3421_001999 [Burkholderia sp. FERM BP-3421]|uniref:hypothetical protein n=1 Tax=Burkholderia sp. FERM BP-3421 TaxID=1494466 RepID=UPI00235F26F6|nr:hypothetical protein [Burkholderia sp. FERM BP-3421]WDD92029.1 hypothetical protein Bsp3421_001999 [Burkholderia sp. FERM BP-3421]